MRNRFVGELLARAAVDPRVFLVVGDLGYSVVEPFAARHPDRFLNAGVAEQGMTGIAAGLAREGFKVFTYSIANFPTMRCLEQIRNDVCGHDLDVTVVAVGGGFMYGSLGPSHHATEDIGVLRTLPRMRLFAPGVPRQVAGVLDEILAAPGPAYVRLGRAGEFPGADRYEPYAGQWIVSRAGAARAVVTVGNVAAAAVGIREGGAGPADHWIAGRLKPLPGEVAEALAAYDEVAVVEDHQRSGGLYSLLAETLYDRAARSGRPRLVSHAVPDAFPPDAGREAVLQAAWIRAPGKNG